MLCAGSSKPKFRSKARPTTASAKRSICAIPTTMASSFIGTGRSEQWPRTADGELAMFTHRLDLMALLKEAEAQQAQVADR